MALPYTQQPNLQVQGGGLDTTDVILERRKEHTDSEQWKGVIYGLRMLVCDKLDITTYSSASAPVRKDGRWSDVLKTSWEEGRHNPIRINTHMQAKALVFNEPDLKWRNCQVDDPADQIIVTKVRKEYYLQELWRKFNMAGLYRLGLLDMLSCGERNLAFWKLPTGLCPEYIDSLDITWDPAYKNEPHRRRYCFVDRPMPRVEAIKEFPALTEKLNYDPRRHSGGEQTVTVTCYYSNSTYAVLYGRDFILPPTQNPYGRIPIRVTELFRELSVKHPTGMVELQVATQKEMLRWQRYFREVPLRMIPIGLFKGQWGADQIAKIRDAEEGETLHAKASSDSFEYVAGAEYQMGATQRYEMLQQQSNAESGVNDFQRGQTDTKVDFASQLGFIAQQSGVLSSYTEQLHEAGIAEDAKMMMEIAAKMEDRDMVLTIDDTPIEFNTLNPINPLLGGDGEIIMAPGGMKYKAPAQKLQETVVLSQSLQLASTLPPGIREFMMKQSLDAYDVDEADQIIQSMVEAEQAMMAQQMQMAAMQSAQQQAPASGGSTGGKSPQKQPQQQPPAGQ